MDPGKRLRDVRALVVGGASGIGREVATAFAAQAASVAAIDRDGDRLAALEDAVAAVAADATDGERLGPAVAEATGALGGLDVLVHTVGIHDGFLTELTSVSSATLAQAASEILATNVTSALLAVQAALPHLERSPCPAVILTVSESAFSARGGGPLYGASKWAVRGLVAHLAGALAPKIRVNGVSPGGTAGSRMVSAPALGAQPVGERPGRDDALRAGNRLGMLMEPADLAGAYVYLAAPSESRAVSGAVLSVDAAGTTA